MKPVALTTTKPGFEPQLREELNKIPIKKKILWTPFRGILIVLSSNPYDFLEVVKENKSNLKFLFRLIPLEIECQTDIDEIKKAVLSLINEKKEKLKNKSFVVRCNRRGSHKFTSEDIERVIGRYILDNFKDLNLKVDLKNWDFKINIEILQNKSYISIFYNNFNEFVIEENIRNLKNLKRYVERPLNRSERKMQELMEKFPFIFENLNCVVDIGSAPGGWAKMLSKKAKKVYAIDTGELKVKAKNIIHIKKRAEDVDFEKDIDEEIDLITNDTNLYPDESIFLTLKFAKYLKSGGYIIHTLKARNLETKKEDLNQVLKILDQYKNIELFKIINLKANTKNELTLILKKL
ncbi:THUMP domain-containing protein [Methanocaldococcus fervens]|uniref:THUMP domain protein n=1 Tax=Methanocaldococcus fervens (strain DSM 4213 / JCM 15782 / AG86) TaxID=573064 RepID=C7P5P2_METFA|nr:THUMP domain-containing protein [Methanocaldococcus fervens]ACV23874.1 THUMP domain protein [Methanocaldococcus fervens AG86]